MLSDADRILLYLYMHRNDFRGIEGDESITQDGIARAVGFRRTHAPRKLNPLMEQGLVAREKAHIPGSMRRKYVYYLTPKGSEMAVDIMRRNGIHSSDLPSLFDIGESQSLDIDSIMENYSVDRGIATLLHELTGGDMKMLDRIFDMLDSIDAPSDAERITIAFLRLKEEEEND